MSDLRGPKTHVELGNAGKIVGAVVIAIAVGVVGVYSYEAGMWKSLPKEVVTSEELPSPGPLPRFVRGMTPPKSEVTAPFSF